MEKSLQIVSMTIAGWETASDGVAPHTLKAGVFWEPSQVQGTAVLVNDQLEK